jgi:hypothetical protein
VARVGIEPNHEARRRFGRLLSPRVLLAAVRSRPSRPLGSLAEQEGRPGSHGSIGSSCWLAENTSRAAGYSMVSRPMAGRWRPFYVTGGPRVELMEPAKPLASVSDDESGEVVKSDGRLLEAIFLHRWPAGEACGASKIAGIHLGRRVWRGQQVRWQAAGGHFYSPADRGSSSSSWLSEEEKQRSRIVEDRKSTYPAWNRP